MVATLHVMYAALLLCLFAPAETPDGQQIRLTTGRLFIPTHVDAKAERIDLWIHLHGAVTVTEPNFARLKINGVLVTITLPGLSSTYAKHFKEPKVFAQIVDEARGTLKNQNLPHVWRRVIVSSFSAGYGGVREFLKDPATYRLIDALLLADTIYAGYVGDATLRQVNAEQMTGFAQFAKDAAAGKKHMLLTHCRLQPDGYAGTHETADYLLAKVLGERNVPKESWNVEGMNLEAQFTRRQLSIFSFSGTTGADHMKHLQQIGQLWRRLPE